MLYNVLRPYLLNNLLDEILYGWSFTLSELVGAGYNFDPEFVYVRFVNASMNFQQEYMALKHNLSEYIVKLVDEVRCNTELETILDKTGTPDEECYSPLARLQLAIACEEKKVRRITCYDRYWYLVLPRPRSRSRLSKSTIPRISSNWALKQRDPVTVFINQCWRNFSRYSGLTFKGDARDRCWVVNSKCEWKTTEIGRKVRKLGKTTEIGRLYSEMYPDWARILITWIRIIRGKLYVTSEIVSL